MKAAELLKKSKLKEEPKKEEPTKKKTGDEKWDEELDQAGRELREKTQAKDKEYTDKLAKQAEKGERVLLTEEEKKAMLARGEIEPQHIYKPRRSPIKIAVLAEIDHKERQKVYDKESPFYGSVNFKLILSKVYNLAENKRPDWIYAFKETIMQYMVPNEATLRKREQLWGEIDRDLYLGKKYTLYCLKNKKGFKLYDWLEHN